MASKKPHSAYPFPFFGHSIPEPGGDGHYWVLRFVEAPAKSARPDIARILAKVLSRGFFLQREETPWRWHEDWLVVCADEHAGAPDTGSEARFAALTEIEHALAEVHAKAPLTEVFALGGETPTGSEWDSWSRADARKPSLKGTAPFRRGKADAKVEQIRLADPGVAAGGGKRLGVRDADAKLAMPTKLVAPLAARVAKFQAIEKRSDRIHSVTTTPAGQVAWFMASSDQTLRTELAISDGKAFAGMEIHSPSRQNYDRALVDGDADGWLLLADSYREAVLEVHPKSGARRYLCTIPCGTNGPIEALRVGDQLVVSTTHGIFVLARQGEHGAIPVAYLPRNSFRHIANVPSGDAIVSCEFGEESKVALVAIGSRAEVVEELKVAPPVREPLLHEGRVLARQGRSLREIVVGAAPPRPPVDERAILAAEAEKRVSRGEAALVPDETTLPTPGSYDGRRVIASCRAAAATVVAFDSGDRHAIEIRPDDGPPRSVPTERRWFVTELDVSPDGRRVLVAGRQLALSILDLANDELVEVGEGMAPRHGFDVTAWIAPDRLLVVTSGDLDIVDTGGKRLERIATKIHAEPNEIAAGAWRNDGRSRDVLYRDSDGNGVLVRAENGSVTSIQVVGSGVAHVFARAGELYAVTNGVVCRLVGPQPR